MPLQRQPECREGEGPTCGKPTGFNTGASNTYVIICAAKLGLVKRETLMLSWQRRLATGSFGFKLTRRKAKPRRMRSGCPNRHHQHSGATSMGYRVTFALISRCGVACRLCPVPSRACYKKRSRAVRSHQRAETSDHLCLTFDNRQLYWTGLDWNRQPCPHTCSTSPPSS